MTARTLIRVFSLALALAAGATANQARAALGVDTLPTPEAHAQCIEATRSAERRQRLAPHLLGAISLVETGRWSRDHKASFAWPWTVMAEGRGRYLPSKAAAIAEVRRLQPVVRSYHGVNTAPGARGELGEGRVKIGHGADLPACGGSYPSVRSRA